MTYPTDEQIESATHQQLCGWWRFLPGPGAAAIGKPDFETVLNREAAAMERIGARMKEFGGFTPAISKELGW